MLLLFEKVGLNCAELLQFMCARFETIENRCVYIFACYFLLAGESRTLRPVVFFSFFSSVSFKPGQLPSHVVVFFSLLLCFRLHLFSLLFLYSSVSRLSNSLTIPARNAGAFVRALSLSLSLSRVSSALHPSGTLQHKQELVEKYMQSNTLTLAKPRGQ